MSDFEISKELKDNLLDIIYDADWYFKCSGTQSEHNSDLSLEELTLEHEDKVVKLIVDEVIQYLSTKAPITYQLKRIADSLDALGVKITPT